MTNRERIRAVFAGHPSAVPPVSMRLDLWHAHARLAGELPADLRDSSPEHVEDHLGFCRAARCRAIPRLELGPDACTAERRGPELIETLRLGRHTLRRITYHDPDQARIGMSGHITEYPLKSETDCRGLLHALETARLVFDENRFDELSQRTGDRGLPVHILGPGPIHLLMLRWAGYENFYYLHADFPELVDRLAEAFEQLFRRDVWPYACSTPAELVLHGVHFSESLTPLPIFRKRFLPYFSDFNRLMHEHGRRVLWHSDTDLGTLAPLMLEAGFDGADCLATAPLVRETMQDYLDCWQGRIVCWGGLPSIIFDASYPMDACRRCIGELADATADRAGVIIGASDNVMPGAQWEKLRYVSDVFAR